MSPFDPPEKLTDETLATDWFWNAFRMLCTITGNDQRERLRWLAKSKKTPVKVLTKYFDAYLLRQAERDARTHPGTNTMQ